MKYRELRRKLRDHGIREDKKRGKGGHRAFVLGETFFTIPYHGDNEDVPRGYLLDIEGLFGITLR